MPHVSIVALLCAPMAAGAGSSDVPGKAEIASLVASQRAQAGTMQVTTILKCTLNESDLAVPLSNTETLAFNGLVFWEQSEIDYGPQETERTVAYDGKEGVEIIQGGGAVVFGSEGSMQTHPLRNSELLWTMRWLDASSTLAPHPKDLIQVLQSPLSSLRAATEDVDGVACAVLDVYSPDRSLVLESLWLDPSAGYLPRLQRSFAGEKVSIERHVGGFVEAAPGVFLPGSAAKHVAGAAGTLISGDVSEALTTLSVSLDAPALDFGTVGDLVKPGVPVVYFEEVR